MITASYVTQIVPGLRLRPLIEASAAEMAASPHRVAQITPAQAGDPETIEKFGPNDTVLKMLRERPAKPLTDSRITQSKLGIVPTPLKEGMRKTIHWFRENRLIPR